MSLRSTFVQIKSKTAKHSKERNLNIIQSLKHQGRLVNGVVLK